MPPAKARNPKGAVQPENIMSDPPVLIVGGGPVGLTLSIDLGHRGVECLLIDKRPAPSFLPKMERCHARTMEHFRRLGIADAVRSVGYPAGLPLDSFLVTSLAEPAIAQLRTPSVIEARKQSEQANDGRWPAEPSQIVSQYALEPLLKDIAENVRGVTVRFNCELLSFEEQEDNVVVRVRDLDGREETIRTRYLIGCDGGSSIVRAGLGFRLEGQANLGQQMQALFHSEDLFDRIAMGKGAHYYRADDQWTFLITQGDTHHFSLHAMIDAESAMPALFESIVGMPISYETLYVGKWTMRRLLSNQYASKRTFLAGDSAHLFTPNGGLGMNTGIGDAIDLAWKLAGTLQGWGGKGLLATYEVERRPIGQRNLKASERAFEARRVWRDLCSAECSAVMKSNDLETRHRLARVWLDEHRKGTSLAGIILGYRYLKSPIISYEGDDDESDQTSYDYIPTTRPGARIPHLWLKDGSAIQDNLREGYALIKCAPGTEPERLVEAFRLLRCPLHVLDVTDVPHAREIYATNYVLLRPDLHVAWRGNSLPADPEGLAAVVTGHI
jgi:2-polyprenyl-6-methoxyphenol hydroxylase-like FAD-dependent oxidoreductase